MPSEIIKPALRIDITHGFGSWTFAPKKLSSRVSIFFVQLSDEMFLKNKFKLEDEVFISWDHKRESLLE